MKFLSKRGDSLIDAGNFTYVIGRSNENTVLRDLLLLEQKGFCAYSEKYVHGLNETLDSVEVEHFNPRLKGNDDYLNYYAAIRDCNLHNKKMYLTYEDAEFFETLFFQDSNNLNERMEYKEGQYIEINADDKEVGDLIEFLGFNRRQLYDQRRRHINRLKDSFEKGNYTYDEKIDHFRKHRQDLDFVTAIEIELALDLSEFYS